MASDVPHRGLSRLRRLVTGVPFLVTVGVLAILFVAYTLAGFFLVPRLIRTYAPRYVQEQLARRAEIGEVRFNPLLFKLEINGFRLTEADGRPLLGFDRLFVDFELSSLFRRAWTFAEIQLDGPRLDATLGRDGRLNLADLLDAFPRSEPPPQPAPPPRLVLGHAVMRRGTVSFTDLTGRKPQTARVEPIDVDLRDISTLPEHEGPYTISATLGGGGVLSWEGEVSLVPLTSSGRLTLRGFPLATAWRFVQEEVALAQPAGSLDAAVRYEVAYRDGAASVQVDGIDVTVAGLALAERGEQSPLLALEKVHVAGGRGDLIGRDLSVAEITLSRGRLAATIGRDGIVNWQKLMTAPPAPGPAPALRTSTTPSVETPVGASAATSPPRPDGEPPTAPGASIARPGIGPKAVSTASPTWPGIGPVATPAASRAWPGMGPEAAHAAPASPGTPATKPAAPAGSSSPRPAPGPAAAPAAGNAAAPAAARPAAGAGPGPWRLAVGRVRVEDVALAFTDRSRAVPIEVTAGDLTVGLAAKVESGPAGLTGVIEDLGVTLARVAAREAGAAKTPPLVSLEQVAIEGGHVDLARRQVAVTRVAVKGGRTTVVRAADGSLPLQAMLAPADRGEPAHRAAAAPGAARPAPPARRSGAAAAAAATRPWAVALARLELADHHVAITDQTVTPPAQVDLTGIKVTASAVRTDGKKPFPFDVAVRIAQGGRVTVRGRAAPDGTTAEAALTVAQLAIAPAQPYVTRTAAVILRSGAVSTAGRLTYRAGRERPAVTYAGTLDVDDVSVVEEATGDPVVAWKSMHADGLRFGLAPDRLRISEVKLTGLDGKLVVFKDKSLSVARLLKTSGAPAGAPPAPPTPAGPAPAGPARAGSAPATTAAGPAPATTDGAPGPALPVTVERVRIDDGSAHFADLSLVLPFATRVHALNGVIVDLGSDAGTRATVKLDGRVDEFGLVRVEGALAASQPKVFTDIAVTFKNVPMATLSPYSATFAGRRIRSGTLDLDLQYKIDKSQLLGRNKVLLRRLQLGERVESPGATRLPLDLAIAILSDSQGRIDVDLPVQGNVDHPEFSYGHLVWQALVTVITKIATAPFRALAGLVGGNAERLQSVTFEPGSDAVLPPERQKLVQVAEVLGKRARLKLTVHGGYETGADGEALRSLHVRQDLAQRLGAKVKPGEDPGPVAFDQVKTQRALEAMLTQRGGDKALEEFVRSYEQRTGKKAERANPVLALVGRGSGDRDLYQALFRRLVETAPLADTEITALGQRRGEAVARVLKERAGEAAARVEVGATEAASGAEPRAIPTRLELGAAGS